MKKEYFFGSVLRATALSLVCSLCGILLFALVVKLAALPTSAVKAVNQFIKVIATFIGCFFSVKGKAGLIKGAVGGALYTVLLYAIFALAAGGGFLSLSLAVDCAFTAIVGGIAGIIAVNVKGKETE